MKSTLYAYTSTSSTTGYLSPNLKLGIVINLSIILLELCHSVPTKLFCESFSYIRLLLSTRHKSDTEITMEAILTFPISDMNIGFIY